MTKNEPDRTDAGENQIDTRVLEMLVCPVTKTTLSFDGETDELISKAAGLAFPIRDGVPVMLPDEARQLDDDA